MQYSSSARLNDVIGQIRALESSIYTTTHEDIAKELVDIRMEIGSILEED